MIDFSGLATVTARGDDAILQEASGDDGGGAAVYVCQSCHTAHSTFTCASCLSAGLAHGRIVAAAAAATSTSTVPTSSLAGDLLPPATAATASTTGHDRTATTRAAAMTSVDVGGRRKVSFEGGAPTDPNLDAAAVTAVTTVIATAAALDTAGANAHTDKHTYQATTTASLAPQTTTTSTASSLLLASMEITPSPCTPMTDDVAPPLPVILPAATVLLATVGDGHVAAAGNEGQEALRATPGMADAGHELLRAAGDARVKATTATQKLRGVLAHSQSETEQRNTTHSNSAPRSIST